MRSFKGKATEKKVYVDSNGRLRMPGDPSMTRGEIIFPIINTSLVQTNDLSVYVTTNINSSQSDPPMREHYFWSKVKITNSSNKYAIQLLHRRFGI